ncbi:MAG: hypothetical protein M3406_11180 [Chloroflexota bacterium]|nr:hypothetical protein [Chloroflexota bacterium]
MLNQNHPDDERLAALASEDADATVDTALTEHLSSCDRCTQLVNELGVLRVALGDLPDMRPSRPLQLLPPVEADRGVDRLGGWARRFFAPLLAGGAALALVGTVGTATPILDQMASGGAGGGSDSAAVQEFAEPAASAAGEPARVGAGGAESSGSDGDSPASPLTGRGSPEARDEAGTDDQQDARGESLPITTPDERSPWPMVLFTGVVLMVAAVGLRWILVPRAA